MKTVRFWIVETPHVIRYFESESDANRFYNGCEIANIDTFVRRSPEKIAAIREQIARDNATEERHNAEMQNLDVQAEAWLKENREDE